MQYYCKWSIILVYFLLFLAVLFLEFWKRQQSVMQYEWNVLGYEDNEVSSLMAAAVCFSVKHNVGGTFCLIMNYFLIGNCQASICNKD